MLTLARHALRPPVAGPLLLVVMDGVGVGPPDEGNAVHLARTPTLDALRRESVSTTLKAHGRAVGLPSDDDMGNSEVGHNALGAGRIFDQGATLVERAIVDGSVFRGRAWNEVLGGKTIHFLGLLSDGNVHSHERHLHALLRAAAPSGKRLAVHVLLDGRDVRDPSAEVYLERLEALLAELRSGGTDARIASGGGRMHVTMDRYEADWAIVERGWRAHVLGDARSFGSALEAVATFRAETPGLSDQFLPPFVVQGGVPIVDGDAVVLFNFRGDRAIQITRAFVEGKAFNGFDRVRTPDVLFAGMTQYDGDLQLPRRFLVQPPVIDNTLGEYLVQAGVPQWACSETQKFGHVTYFWNGNRSEPFDARLDRWQCIESDRVPFEQRPWMKAAEITDAAIAALTGGEFRFLRLNFANGDMVGHTGLREPAIQAVEAVDLCLGRLLPWVRKLGGAAIVTADHGNADEMWKRDKRGAFVRMADGRPQPSTSHSLAAVPFYLQGLSCDGLAAGGGLANVAATVLDLLGFEPPPLFEPSLLRGPIGPGLPED